MDMMSLRRVLMAQMAGGSILDSLLEIVDAVTPTVASNTITFNAPADEGGYVIVGNPPGTPAVAAAQTQAQIPSITHFRIVGISTKSVGALSTLTIRKTPTASTAVDYWSPSVTIGNGTISVQLATGGGASYCWLTNCTYYLLKVKGM